jgi:hypothetical protein
MRSGYRVLVVNLKGDIGVKVNNNPKGKLKGTENTCRLHVQRLKMPK